MVRYIFCILCAVLMFGSLTGCWRRAQATSSTETTTKTESKSSAAGPTAEAPSDPGTGPAMVITQPDIKRLEACAKVLNDVKPRPMTPDEALAVLQARVKGVTPMATDKPMSKEEALKVLQDSVNPPKAAPVANEK